jgi:dephospho-CoA kinase
VLRVGLTGVIGCGKSLVASILQEKYAIPVIDMDSAGRAAVERPVVRRRLREAFGAAIFSAPEILDRRALGRIVFADPEQRRRLNAIVHPAMLTIVQQHMRQAAKKQESAPYLVVDAALIFELGFEKKLDRVVTVYAPHPLCLERAGARDHLSPGEVEQRLASQLPQEEKCRRADYILDNSGGESDLPGRVAALHSWLLGQTGF